jgi:hypothetical protein
MVGALLVMEAKEQYSAPAAAPAQPWRPPANPSRAACRAIGRLLEIERYLYETPPKPLREGRSEARREARRVDEVPADPPVKPRERLSLSTVSPFYARPVQRTHDHHLPQHGCGPAVRVTLCCLRS